MAVVAVAASAAPTATAAPAYKCASSTRSGNRSLCGRSTATADESPTAILGAGGLLAAELRQRLL
ncbi:hypothetical protein ACFY0G_39880 [Streptomyces sp. NPDC001552]|uniref:hypothetical protein n=1 Tax=Streptomyces sp. NPDC001552 TaxID=3364587 RepID=UPI00367DE9B3